MTTLRQRLGRGVAGALVGAAALGSLQMAGHEAGMTASEAPPASVTSAHLSEKNLGASHMSQVQRQVEFKHGVECRTTPKAGGALPERIIQHRTADPRDPASGWETARGYRTGKALKQADLANGGANATHQTDAFCY